MQALGTAEHGSQRLQGNPDNVVFRLLGRQRDAGGLGVEAAEPGAGILRAKGFAHLPGPDAAGGPKLGNLFKKIVVAVEKEAQARRKIVNIQPSL